MGRVSRGTGSLGQYTRLVGLFGLVHALSLNKIICVFVCRKMVPDTR